MSIKSIPFSDVVDKIGELSGGNHDVIIGTGALSFLKEEAHPYGSLVTGADEGSKGDEFPLTKIGFVSMARQLGIPAKYMQKLDADEEMQHVNMWLRDEDTTWQLRLNAANGVRSVQKAGFTPIDILPTLQTIQPMVEDDGMVVTHVVPDLDDFHLRCVWPNNVGGESDPLHAGFHMNGTEANLHLFTVDAACYRHACLNTAILRRGKPLFAQRHYHLNFDEFRPRLLDGLLRVQVVGKRLCDALMRCRDEEMNPAAMEQELRRLLNMRALPKRFVEQAVEAIEEGRVEEPTRFGLINLVTREAQEFGQGERAFGGRMRVENVAGRMLIEYMGATAADPAPSATMTLAPPLPGDESHEQDGTPPGPEDEPPGPEGEPEMVGDGSSEPDPAPSEVDAAAMITKNEAAEAEGEERDLEAEMQAALEGVPEPEETDEAPEPEPEKPKAKPAKKARKKPAKKARKKAAKKRKKVDEPDERTVEEVVAEDAEEPDADEPEADEPEAEDMTDIEDAEEHDDDETAEQDEEEAEDSDADDLDDLDDLLNGEADLEPVEV